MNMREAWQRTIVAKKISELRQKPYWRAPTIRKEDLKDKKNMESIFLFFGMNGWWIYTLCFFGQLIPYNELTQAIGLLWLPVLILYMFITMDNGDKN